MNADRRRFLLTISSLSVLPILVPGWSDAAEDVIELEWSDLAPTQNGTRIDRLRQLGVVQHGQLSTPFDQETAGIVTDAYNGKTVRIPGYLIPLELDGTAMTVGLLVPYVGACIHVPPPPPNQLIFITVEEPYESGGLFEPVWVTGTFGIAATETQLAEVGYAMSAGQITPYS